MSYSDFRSLQNGRGNKFERKTYGQLLQDRKFAEHLRLSESWDFAQELMKGMIEDVNAEIKEHGNGKYKDKTFYVMSLVLTETFGKVPLTKTLSAESCPYPSLNQTVWKIDHDKQDAFLLWALPDKKTANLILNNPAEYLKKGNKETFKYVQDLRDGVLKNISDRENGFKKDMAVIIKNEGDV